MNATMAIDERGRHDLYVRLEELMGTERADALMGLLPPVGWADVATKHDLVALEERIDLRVDALEDRFGGRFEALEDRFGGLAERMDLRFEALEHRFSAVEPRIEAKLHAELRSQMRVLFFGLLTALFTMASICIAAITLAR